MIVLKRQVHHFGINKAREFITQLPAEELEWPAHRWAPEITQLWAYLPPFGIPADPQIIVHKPDAPEIEWAWKPHLDKLPVWSRRIYSAICGIAITGSGFFNGGVRVPGIGNKPITPKLNVGDVIVLGPEEPHCQGTNHSAQDRVMVYMRFLEAS